jgi:hypothetical protein
MFEAALVLVVIGALCAVPALQARAPTVTHHHHHQVTIVQRPVYVQAQINLIQAEIALSDARRAVLPPEAPRATALVPAGTALRRYRGGDPGPS